MTKEELESLEIKDAVTYALREEVMLLREEKAELADQFDDLRTDYAKLEFEHARLEELARHRLALVVTFG